MSNYIITTSGLVNYNEFRHHGIKGMKWGVRRYQNADGSLTPSGRRRYGSVENFNRVMGGNTSFAPRKPKGQDLPYQVQRSERQKRWEDDHGINPNRPNGTKPALLSKRQKDISKATKGLDRDIESLKPYIKTGIKTKSGKLMLTSNDVKSSINALEKIKNKKISKINARYDKKIKNIDEDINSFKPYVNSGIKTKKGKIVISREDVLSIIDGLEKSKTRYK